MRITLLNQTFHPDVGSSGQHLTDLALSLAGRGHQVTVITSRRAYDDPGRIFPKREDWRGMRIYRVFNTGFGKRAKWRRAADFASFLVSCSSRLCRLPKQDLVVALTSPPLVSALGAWFARIRGGRFCYWVMDLNPDEAIAAGWLAPRSLAARSLERISRYSLRRASTVVVLDRFMQKKILDKGIDGSKVGIFPPWSHDSEVRFDLAGRNLFRATHGLENKFVVMYSGNHSPCHPLDSILSAARALGRQQDVAFCFVGGGSEFVRVKRFSADHHLANITCLPYQPLDQLAGTLSAADLHLVVMGDPFVGLVHPCKIYNILRVGLPLLYVGPSPSHVTEMLAEVKNSFACRFARHGEIDPIIQHILELKKNGVQPNGGEFTPLTERFSRQVLLPRMIELLEASGRSPARCQCNNSLFNVR